MSVHRVVTCREGVILTVADVISVAVDKGHLDSRLQEVFEVGDILPGGVTDSEEGIRDGVGCPAEIDRGAKVVLNPFLVEEACGVHVWLWVRQWVRNIKGRSLQMSLARSANCPSTKAHSVIDSSGWHLLQ